MASHILGISGRKRSGKDTLAARLVTHHGFTRVAFADPLKAVALDLDPWIWVEPDEAGHVWGSSRLHNPDRVRLSSVISGVGWETAKSVREVRRLLQVLGVAVRDHVDPDAWVSAAYRRIEEIPGPVVVTDVRFPNEVDIVRLHGGRIVRVTRPGLPETDLHVSETALDALVADYPVTNDSSISALHAEADAVAVDLLSGS